MSLYGYLLCHDCARSLWLGRALRDGVNVTDFHIGGSDEPPMWERSDYNEVLWRFLAEHTRHRIEVRLGPDMTEDMYSYCEIGGDTPKDISFSEYLGH